MVLGELFGRGSEGVATETPTRRQRQGRAFPQQLVVDFAPVEHDRRHWHPLPRSGRPTVSKPWAGRGLPGERKSVTSGSRGDGIGGIRGDLLSTIERTALAADVGGIDGRLWAADDLSGYRAGGRQDLRHADGGPAPGRERERVVVGWLEGHERAETLAQVGDLKVIHPVPFPYRGHDFAELDLPAVLATQPDVVIVDELAHRFADGSRERWMDVADLLAAGADVLTSVNVANLTSARDYAARVTGSGSVESVPDGFARSGDVVLMDLPSDALRRRIASGRVYTADRVGGALSEYFRVSNLEALSELGRGLDDRQGRRSGCRSPGSAGPGCDLLMPGGPGGRIRATWGEEVIRRAVDLAGGADSDLLARSRPH